MSDAERRERERLEEVLHEVKGLAEADSDEKVLGQILRLIKSAFHSQVTCKECGSADVTFVLEAWSRRRVYDASPGTLRCNACGHEIGWNKPRRRRFPTLDVERADPPDFMKRDRDDNG